MPLLCVNGHNNDDTVRFCRTCGSNQFQPGGPILLGAAPRYNGMAIASLVVLLLWVPVLTPIAQIILAVKARDQIRTTGEQGDGLATAGLVLGIIGLIASVMFIVGIIVAFVLVAHAHGGSGAGTP